MSIYGWRTSLTGTCYPKWTLWWLVEVGTVRQLHGWTMFKRQNLAALGRKRAILSMIQNNEETGGVHFKCWNFQLCSTETSFHGTRAFDFIQELNPCSIKLESDGVHNVPFPEECPSCTVFEVLCEWICIHMCVCVYVCMHVHLHAFWQLFPLYVALLLQMNIEIQAHKNIHISSSVDTWYTCVLL